MKYLQSYKDHNENLKNIIASAGVVGTLLTGSPDAMSKNSNLQTELAPRDGVNVNRLKLDIQNISNERSLKCKDSKLNNILDSIKSNINSNDSSKLSELFTQLSTHMEDQYGYKISEQNIDNLETSEIGKGEKSKVNLFYILGWLGSMCLALCGVPQAIQSYQDKHSHGISWGFLLLWGFGEIFAMIYVFEKLDIPLLMNYAANILIVGIMVYYKIKPHKNIDGSVEDFIN
jgi:uncharacterized protein with PQ loop repeat